MPATPSYNPASLKLPTALTTTLLLLAAAALFLFGAYRQATLVNTDVHRTDQHSYLKNAKDLKDSGYRYLSDGARGVAYPFLLTLFCDLSKEPADAFPCAKILSTLLALLLSILLGIFFVRQFGWHAGLNAALLSAFTVFMFRAPYAQPEPLFYTLFFLAFYYQWRALQSPKTSHFLLIGLFTALAYYAKHSSLPALAAFLAVYYLKHSAAWLKSALPAPLRKTNPPSKPATLHLKTLALPLLSVAVFLAILSPLIRYNITTYGKPFYNANTQFYMWCNSGEEAFSLTRAHGDRSGWPQMPPEEIPSLKKYLSEHSLHDISQRIIKGYARISHFLIHSFRAGPFLVGLALLAALMAIQKRHLVRRLLIRQTGILWLFALLCLAGYSFSIAWFSPVSNSARYLFMLFLPVLFMVTLAITQLGRKIPVRFRGKTYSATTVVLWLWSLALLIDTFHAVFFRSGTFYGGG